MRYLILLIIFIGCTPEKEQVFNVNDYVVDKKYCISKCVEYKFHMFHHSESFGGSSSMNGLQQTQIYTTVTNDCNDFYKDEKCCQDNIHTNNKIIVYIHDYKYGPCVK